MKETKSMTIRLTVPVAEQLNQFCKDSGQTKTFAMERAIVQYMELYYKQQEQLEKMKLK